MAAFAGPIRGWPTFGRKVMIMILGKTEQVATELHRLADVLALGRDQTDLSDLVAGG